jgi:hypothetical protein
MECCRTHVADMADDSRTRLLDFIDCATHSTTERIQGNLNLRRFVVFIETHDVSP